MSRTPLLGHVCRALRKAARSESVSREDHEAATSPIGRRAFLRWSGSVAGAALVGRFLPGCRTPGAPAVGRHRHGRDGPRVAVVGAGLAGLTAAYRLTQAGLRVDVYEAAGRVGGRAFSARDLLAPGLVTELGGEFIDSGHLVLRELVRELGLDLRDMQADRADLCPVAYYFDGRHYYEAEIVAAFRPLAGAIEHDVLSLGDESPPGPAARTAAFDRLSLAEYLDRIEARGVARRLLEVAFVTEYGLDTGEQSALNLLMLINPDTSGGRLELYGASDQRYKVVGGTQRITDELARRLDGAVAIGHRLVALRSDGARCVLSFEKAGGAVQEATADFVVLAVPFTTLREVQLDCDLPPVQRRAIAELRYGTNAKLLVGFAEPVWRGSGFGGDLFTDLPLQSGWDHGRGQGIAGAGYTIYLGGTAGVESGIGTPSQQASRHWPALDRIFPRAVRASTGRVERFHWPTHPWSRGSYSCWGVGQYTSFAGVLGRPAGPVHFAGEHCSTDSAGYLNGAAETGVAAAEQVRTAARV